MIQSLVTNRDSFEIVRDAIVSILLTETASQQALATAAGENPEDWKFLVFQERSNAWEVDTDEPYVNVFLESSTPTAGRGGNTDLQQTYSARFSIDCYTRGLSKATPTGHVAADKAAAIGSQRLAALVRKFLMASIYDALDLERSAGIVRDRIAETLTPFQPTNSEGALLPIVATRVVLRVDVTEFDPQYEGCPLEEISINFRRKDTGQVVLTADFDYR